MKKNRMSTNTVAKNFLYNVMYQVLCIITPLITTPYISRVLGADGIGTFSYVQAIASYFILIGTLGSSLYGQREIAYVQRNADKRTVVFKDIESLRLVTVVFASIVYFICFCRKGENQIIYLIFLIEIIASGVDISWFFRGIQDFQKAVTRNFIIRIVSVFLVFVLVKSKSDVPMYAICYVVPIFVGNISLWFYLPQYLTRIKRGHIISAKHIKPLIALFIPQIATEVYLVLDKTMLGSLSRNMAEVGYYTQAQKLVQLALKFITALGVVMLPKISDAFAQKKYDEINKSIVHSINFILLLGFAIMFGLIGIASSFVPWFYGEGFDKVSLLICLMAPVVVIIGISNVFGTQYLLSVKLQKNYTLSVFTGMCVNLIFNFILIPLYGAIGATIATLLAESSVSLVQLITVRNLLPIKRCFSGGWKYIFAGLIMLLSISFLKIYLPAIWISTFILVICGMIIYFMVLFILKDKMLYMAIDLIKQKLMNIRTSK